MPIKMQEHRASNQQEQHTDTSSRHTLLVRLSINLTTLTRCLRRKTLTKKSTSKNLGKGTYQTLKYGLGGILKSTGFSDDTIKSSSTILDLHDNLTNPKISDTDKILDIGRKVSPTITYEPIKQTFDKAVFFGSNLVELGSNFGLKIF